MLLVNLGQYCVELHCGIVLGHYRLSDWLLRGCTGESVKNSSSNLAHSAIRLETNLDSLATWKQKNDKHFELAKNAELDSWILQLTFSVMFSSIYA